MKKAILILICFILALAPILSCSENYNLSETEKEYLGSWVMYMVSGDITYLYTITFFDDLNVVLKTVSFDGSKIKTDNVASGEWCSITSDVIVLTLAKNDFMGSIDDDGLFKLVDYNTHDAMGFFFHCPDLSYLMV